MSGDKNLRSDPDIDHLELERRGRRDDRERDNHSRNRIGLVGNLWYDTDEEDFIEAPLPRFHPRPNRRMDEFHEYIRYLTKDQNSEQIKKRSESLTLTAEGTQSRDTHSNISNSELNTQANNEEVQPTGLLNLPIPLIPPNRINEVRQLARTSTLNPLAKEFVPKSRK